MKKRRETVMLCCENSAYIAVEHIKESGLLESVTVVKIPCAGRIKTDQILEYIHQGVSNVFILVCPLDSCKYIKGNKRAVQRVAAAKQALKDGGLDQSRIRIDFLSSLDTHKIAGILQES